MNRIALESIAGGRRASVGSQFQHLRGGGGGGKFAGVDADDGLDLFSRTRRSNGDPIRLEKIAVGSTRIGKGMEDLLDAEIGKHDYDWLLTPPETPLYPSVVVRESPASSTTPPPRESPASSTSTRGRTAIRSVSNTRSSRLSASQTENGHSTRPVRSSSVTRPSISSTYSSTSSNINNRTSVLNTSSASVTSSRPSTPGSRSTTSRPSLSSTATRPSLTSTATRPSSVTSTARPTLTSRSVPSRLPTPTRTRPNPSAYGDRTIHPNNSRHSTPTSSRPQTPSNPSVSSRASSRPATPTLRPSSSAGASTSNTASRFPSVGRISSTTTRNPAAPASRPNSPGPHPRNLVAPASRASSPGPRPRNPTAAPSRPSSPGPRPRAPVRPIDLPDFPVDAPPNLRTKLPERPASVGRTRPGMGLTVRASDAAAAAAAAAAPASSNRRNYMPVVSRGRLPENPPRSTAKLHGNNGHEVAAAPEIQKISSDGGLRRPAKPVSATDSTGFGRTISKKSLDMALRHMDIRQGMGGIRASSLFPQSIRSAATKGRPARKSDPVVPLARDEAMLENGSWNGTISPDCRSSISIAHSENGDFAAVSKSPDRESLATRDSELDLHGISRYDAFMLNDEDSKNMSWLHSAEDKPDQSPVFDHRFEPLPEPFGLL